MRYIYLKNFIETKKKLSVETTSFGALQDGLEPTTP